MKTIKKYLALVLVLTCIGCGGILLSLDYSTLSHAWCGILGAVVYFTAGICLGYLFDKKEMLPK